MYIWRKSEMVLNWKIMKNLEKLEKPLKNLKNKTWKKNGFRDLFPYTHIVYIYFYRFCIFPCKTVHVLHMHI